MQNEYGTDLCKFYTYMYTNVTLIPSQQNFETEDSENISPPPKKK